MLSNQKLLKFTQSIKDYKKKFLDKPLGELDESGTRLLINHFLTEILGYETLSEVKTEYMIKGTYADYVVQIGGKRHFLVEVKALSLNLSANHLRQSINYGANEGIDFVLLTNGRVFELYKVLFVYANKCIHINQFFKYIIYYGRVIQGDAQCKIIQMNVCASMKYSYTLVTS
jgi:hypothetical protein